MYDIIGGGNSFEPVYSFRIVDILNALENSTANSVRFWGTNYTVGPLCSWRGSYDIPSLTYKNGYKSPQEIAQEIREALKQEHYGYKGGEYKFCDEQIPYISAYGCSEEYQIVNVEEADGILYLCTKIVPY